MVVQVKALVTLEDVARISCSEGMPTPMGSGAEPEGFWLTQDEYRPFYQAAANVPTEAELLPDVSVSAARASAFNFSMSIPPVLATISRNPQGWFGT